MLFIVIAAILIAFSYEPAAGLERTTRPEFACAGVILAVASNWLLAELFAWFAVRRLSRDFFNRGLIMRSYQRLRWMHTAVLLGSYAGVVHGLDWPAVVRLNWGLERWVLVDDLLVLAPFAASVLLAWLAHFRVEEMQRRGLETQLIHPPRWGSRLAHLDFHLRHHLGVVLVPLLLLITIQDSVALAFEDSPNRSAVELTAGVAGLGAVLIFAPVFLRFLWRAKPLPAGPLRDRLELLSRRLRFRASDILIWNTHGAVINAAVAGILPRPRYVLLSDGLLNHLTPDEVEAVFGHEVGHIRHHHLWFFIAFLQGASVFLLLTMSATGQLLTSLVGQSAADYVFFVAQGLALPFASLVAYFGIFFGFLSRRFERQADIFGCRAVSCGRPDCPDNHYPQLASGISPALCPAGIQVFVQALEKIAILNGAMRDSRSWRHFSIAKRVEFLQQMAARPEVERSFQRVVLLLKSLLILALLGGAWYVMRQSPDALRELVGW